MYANANHPAATWHSSAPAAGFWQQQGYQQQQQQYHQNHGMQQQAYQHQQQQQYHQHRQQQQQLDRRQPYHNQQQANSSRGEQQASHAADRNGGRVGTRGTQPQPHRQHHQQQQAAASTPSSSRPHKRARGVGQQQEQPQAQAAQQQQLLRQPPPRALPAPWLDVLRDELLQFAQAALPSPQEDEQRRAALSSFQAVVQSVLGSRGIEVMLFGSARAGLALHSSDLDIMITGTCAPAQAEPLCLCVHSSSNLTPCLAATDSQGPCVPGAGLCSPTAANGGFSREGKQVVVKFLRKVMGGAHSRMSVRASRMIAHARIPVLKLELVNGIELDVSLNDGSSGVSAANFLQSWVREGAGGTLLCGALACRAPASCTTPAWLLQAQHTHVSPPAMLALTRLCLLLVCRCVCCLTTATRLPCAAAAGAGAQEHPEAQQPG